MEELTIQDRLYFLVFSLFVFVLAVIIAWRFGYFKWPKQGKEVSLSLFSLISLFILYFFLELFFPSFLSVAWTHFSSIPISREWLMLLTLFITSAAVFLFSLFVKPEVWNRYQHTPVQLIKDLLMGMVTWFIAFPLVMAIAQVVFLLVLYFTQHVPVQVEQVAVKYLKGLFDQPILFTLTAVVIAVAVPIAEEILFRGFLQTWFRQWLGRYFAIVFSSIIFAFMHFSFQQKMSNWELLSALFALSCFLGFIYERQGSLWAPIALHSTFNSVSISLLLSRS